jgi:uncharacterized membrane protein
VNQTEIIHGVHIIAELLEAIIDQNPLGLDIAELEGDAVFFYKVGVKPEQEAFFKQIKNMYNSFHKQLLVYERDRICNCGACSTANKLSLKFVGHYGDVVERSIQNHFQLMGADVTLVHKFLKNSLNESEYILLTKNAIAINNNLNAPDWIDFKEGKEIYDGIGEVEYIFSKLDRLKQILPSIDKRREIETIENPIEFSIDINAPIDSVYAALTDVELKKEWVNGLREVIQNKERVHRVGSSHDCLLPIGAVHIETVENILSKDEIVFTEFTDASTILPAFYQRNTLKKTDSNKTDISIEVHYKGGYLKETILRLSMKSVLLRSLKKFKSYCENNEVNPKLLIA